MRNMAKLVYDAVLSLITVYLFLVLIVLAMEFKDPLAFIIFACVFIIYCFREWRGLFRESGVENA